MNRRLAFLSTVLLITVPVMGATGIVGVVVSQGQLQVNNAPVDGNANLTSGAVVRTAMAPSRVHLANGSNLTLDRNSQAKILEDRVVLERGSSQFASKNSYGLEAMGFRVSPDAFTQVRVQAEGDRMVVSALNGGVRVTDSRGLPIARLTAGRSLSFQPSTATSSVSTMTGRVTKENGKFVLPDDVSGLKVELSGQNLDSEVGQRVQVTGNASPSTDRSTQVIKVAKLNRVAGDEASPSPAPTPNPTPTPSPKPAAAQSGGAAVAVIMIAATAGMGIAAGVLATQSN